jgi:hypothetical protein
MPGAPHQTGPDASFGVVGGLAKIHQGYSLRPPPRQKSSRLLPFRKLFMTITLKSRFEESCAKDSITAMQRTFIALGRAVLTCILLFFLTNLAHAAGSRLEKRWLFIWRNMSDPNEVERMIARFPRAAADGYNGVAFSYNVAPEKAAALKQAAQKYHLELAAIVMGNAHDGNYAEGVMVTNALFIAGEGRAVFAPENPTVVRNGDFEDASGNHFKQWQWQDDEGITTFADHDITHNGKISLRMENIGSNSGHHCRIMQPIQLEPHRQYHISVWVKTEGLVGVHPEVKVLATNTDTSISFQTFHCEPTQDWKRYDLCFNSFGYSNGLLYVGSWSGKSGKLWWDDLRIEEIGLVNVLRRPGCPVTVRGEDGQLFEEGRDYEPISDPLLNPWQAWHERPAIKLTPATRITDGMRVRVSYYHPIIVYDEGVTSCVSEPKILDDWRKEVKQADDLFHPAAYIMSQDEMRVMNQCALCQSRHLTPGELLARNVHDTAQVIRDLRPDAEIWVWSDMFDPMHNAVAHYYAVNGPLTESWNGLDTGIGILNWHGGLKGKNCKFFADLGLRQILCGYYDGDEDGSGIVQWLHNTAQIPGIVGVMYTTWEDKYGAMDIWAKAVETTGQ